MLSKLKVGLVLGGAIWLAGCAALRSDQQASAQDDVVVAWWLDTHFEPSKTRVLGLPVTRFNAEWVEAQALDDAFIKKQVSEDEYQAVLNSQLKFDLEHSIDSDPEKERFVVGVYETKSGDKGRFLAILDGGSEAKVFEYPGLPGYSALLLMDGDVYWYKCMECDDFDKLEWSGSGYQLK